MLAEMGDTTFRLGNLHADSYAEHHARPTRYSSPLEESFALSAPMCTDCAFEPYCGADPVYHHATIGRLRRPQAELRLLPAEHGASSAFSSTATKVTEFARDLFLRWACR